MGLSREMCKIGIDRRPRVDAKPAFTAVEDKATVETGPSAMVVFLGGAVLRSVAFYRSPGFGAERRVQEIPYNRSSKKMDSCPMMMPQFLTGIVHLRLISTMENIPFFPASSFVG